MQQLIKNIQIIEDIDDDIHVVFGFRSRLEESEISG